jgi:hypothetical protein
MSMLVRKSFGAVLLLAFATAACGGANPTDAPAGASQNPAATQDGGDGGGDGGGGGGGGTLGFDNGKVHYEATGSVQASGDLGFAPASSRFDPASASSLTFANNTDTSDVFLIVQVIEDAVSVSFTNSEFSLAGTTCTATDLKVEARSASGKFECDTAFALLLSGATVGPAHISGSFDAHV